MLNRIRRALSRTKERYLPTGRQRRLLTPFRPTIVHHGRCDWHTSLRAPRRIRTDALAGEGSALVRPYVLASEERELQRLTSVPHDSFTYTWFAPAEAL
ncbi:hypothetical protein [Streptomyces sp. NPDC057580]|uniref:hypothetical protein n=1 Tax=Streptomyces sp. NPDC057580 TaxID=3346173 RepID=UPI0036B301A1